MSILTPRFFIGWDVGAWNCQNNGRSRDALVILTEDGPGLSPTWLGGRAEFNLRERLDQTRLELLSSLFRACGVEGPGATFDCTLAIDTPLGWPKAMRDLLSGNPSAVPEDADKNPYLFRQTEVLLFHEGRGPLSAVRDMIGSQSTKGIHFLHRAGLNRSSVGVWNGTYGSGTNLTAIETYPSPCLYSPTLCREAQKIFDSGKPGVIVSETSPFRTDLDDAIFCAVVGWLHSTEREKLQGPPDNVLAEEGWIWLPRDFEKPTRAQRRQLKEGGRRAWISDQAAARDPLVG
jgi:hypothetical protein